MSEKTLAFSVDLSAYERCMNPIGEDWDDAYLLLVNPGHRMAEDQELNSYVLGRLVKISDSVDYHYRCSESLMMNETAMKALSAMFIEAAANGYKGLDVASAYRSYARQNDIFNTNCQKTYHWICEDVCCAADWIGKDSKCPICGKISINNTLPITKAEKESQVATYSCAPGISEHQTGLAVDIIDTTLPSPFDQLILEYGETKSGKWLAENCWKFGYILRFPSGKEATTGIIYEPWHFRYVGRAHAERIFELELCLEEYVVYLSSIGGYN